MIEFSQNILGNQIAGIDVLVSSAKGSSRVIISLKTQLQKKFKHAKVFGIQGSANNETLQQFSNAIKNHVKSESIKVIKGTYHQTQQVIHYLDPSTGVNVIKDLNGKFISVWRLSPSQLQNVLKRGSL